MVKGYDYMDSCHTEHIKLEVLHFRDIDPNSAPTYISVIGSRIGLLLP